MKVSEIRASCLEKWERTFTHYIYPGLRKQVVVIYWAMRDQLRRRGGKRSGNFSSADLPKPSNGSIFFSPPSYEIGFLFLLSIYFTS